MIAEKTCAIPEFTKVVKGKYPDLIPRFSYSGGERILPGKNAISQVSCND